METEEKTIILYSTGCPKCRVLEKKLNEKGISFEIENNIETLRKAGILTVPVLSVDGQMYQFADAVSLVNNL